MFPDNVEVYTRNGIFFRLEGTTRFLNAIEEVLGNAEYFLHGLN